MIINILYYNFLKIVIYLDIIINNDTIEFYSFDSITANGLLSNDTIYLLNGFEYYDIDCIFIVNSDSLLSSTPNLETSNNLSFTRIDLTGDWEQLNYHWNGGINRDTCEIIQERDSVYFYKATDCFATAYLKKDSIIVTSGFDELGIDYFSMYSNDSFDKVIPLVEAIDRVLFLRLRQTVGIESKQDNSSIQIFPNPTSECVRIVSGDKLIQRIILYSMSGEKLKTQHIDNQFADLNISDLIYGIYILEIVFDDNRLTNMKIMKY